MEIKKINVIKVEEELFITEPQQNMNLRKKFKAQTGKEYNLVLEKIID